MFNEVLEARVKGWWLLGTGTGRCGTGYFAQVLHSVGIQCSHEGVFGADTLEETVQKLAVRTDPANHWWGWEAESSWLAPPFLDRPELEGVTVVHLVREPKKVIDSQMRIRAFTEGDNHWRRWQLQWLPELEDRPEVEQAALFYVRWNRMIEAHKPPLRYRVDKDSILELLDLLGVDWRDKEVYRNKRYNSRAGWGPSDVDLDGLPEPLRGELREMSEGYGYEWPGH